uniref:Uncharacterized protein n=1 Tax=viral metagenome TaxID=1070528 RepID=A0A6C0J2C0_9ZZZZ
MYPLKDPFGTSPVFVSFPMAYAVTAKEPDDAAVTGVPPFVEVYAFVPSK